MIKFFAWLISPRVRELEDKLFEVEKTLEEQAKELADMRRKLYDTTTAWHQLTDRMIRKDKEILELKDKLASQISNSEKYLNFYIEEMEKRTPVD